MRLVSFRELHRDPKVNELELARLESHGLCRGEVNPIGLAANVGKFRDGFVEVLNFYSLCRHGANI